MKFKASKMQIAQLSANAYNASVPMGMGFLHFTPEEESAESFLSSIEEGYYSQDYTHGRMVKLYLSKVEGEENTYELPDSLPRADYQSWSFKYPTYDDLLESAGISA